VKSLGWLGFLVAGTGLLAVSDWLLRSTSNSNFIAPVLLIGAYLVPITLVIFFYEHIHDRDISRMMLLNSFLVGGGIGLIAAGVVEFSTLSGLHVSQLAAVAVIEETAKLIFPLIVFAMWRDRHEADGLIFGVAVGMGFAALETTGYGLQALTQNNGGIPALEQVLIIRGVLSPAGHAAWTGLVCATLWRERERAGRPVFNLAVIGFFVLAVVLHFVWDVVNTVKMPAPLALAGILIVAGLSLGFLVVRYREARRDLLRLASMPPPRPPFVANTPGTRVS
jgi:RsiW-degrading membrane proteinase PrsW (M82 family)